MSHHDATPPGPDLAVGVPLASVPATGVLAGHVGDATVLLARLDDGLFAVSGSCTHYGGPLAEGLVVDGQVHCPWHHACFSLRTGAALAAPAFAPLQAWRVEVVGDVVFVRGEQDDASDTASQATARTGDAGPRRIVIVGGGAAGFAAAQRLRDLGYDGALAMLSADSDTPYDRPNLSKDYLAGTAEEDWIPLQSPAFYRDHDIDLHLDCNVERIDVAQQQVLATGGDAFAYDALLLATGGAPITLQTPGFAHANVVTLRTLADARALIERTRNARSVVLVGGGFIGLEAAGALRARGLDVHVVAREQIPLEKVFGPQIGAFVLQLHREHDVTFHLGRNPAGYDGRLLTLDDGTRIPADIVVVGIGVQPRTQLATAAGLTVDNGIVVDARLQASRPGIYAAGDVARYPHRGEQLRIEHWVHAERQGQRAAHSMLGSDHDFDDVPFFWTHQHDVEIRYSGHAASWDEARMDGSPDARDCTVRYFRGGRLLAAASIGRDLENLQIEAQLREAACAAVTA